MRHRLAALLLVVFAIALTGCQALPQLLGVQPRADAPAYSGVGVVVFGSDNETRQASRADQSGAVGAQGSAQQSAEQSLEIPAEAIDAMIGAAQALLATGNPAAAAGVLDALRAAKQKPQPAAPVSAPPHP